MKVFGLVVSVVVGGLVLVLLGLIGFSWMVHAVGCEQVSENWRVSTEWNPIQGCTAHILGTDIRVGP